MKIGVVDYGVGNLGSVLRALEELSVTPMLVNRAVDMHLTDALILPGVGSFTNCVQILEKDGWMVALRDEVLGYKRPLLGICLGMQLLADESTEGASEGQSTPGLGFISGQIKHLKELGCTNRLPHIGWNEVTRIRNDDHLLDKIPNGTDFYFVHSYAFVTKDSNDIIATTNYGIPLTAAVQCGHVWGTQFHPEKSSRAGFRVLQNFIEGPGC